jgi:hypothetical protein
MLTLIADAREDDHAGRHGVLPRCGIRTRFAGTESQYVAHALALSNYRSNSRNASGRDIAIRELTER